MTPENINHVPCPFTNCGSSDAFSYNTDGYGRCHSCGQSYPHKGMSVYDWCEDRYPTSNNINRTYTPKGVVTVKPKLVETDVTPKYITYRGITPKTRDFFKAPVYLDSDENIIKTEYVYGDGTVKTRVHPKEFYTSVGFKSDQLYGMNLFPAGSAKAVTICEGEEDAMSAYQMLGGYPVVSLPGATPSRKLLENCKDWLNSFEMIYLSLDADNKADKFALSLMRLFPGKVYKVPHDKYKDANDFLQAGKTDAYKKAWWSSGLYTPDNIYASEEKFLELLHDTPEHSYVPTGIKALDEKILGLMRGHFTVIKGPTGIGKSELMRYLECNFIKNYPSVRFATWHLEETKLRSLLGVVSYYLGDNLTRKDLIDQKGRLADVERAIHEITTKTGYMQFHLREEDGADELIDQIRVLTQVYGCEFVMLEPIQDVVTIGSDESKESALAELSVRLSKLAADLNVGIITIAHTNEQGEVKYCRMIGQRASVIIDIHRDKESENLIDRNTTSLVIKKNRPTGLEGEAGELMFDADTFTLSEKVDTW